MSAGVAQFTIQLKDGRVSLRDELRLFMDFWCSPGDPRCDLGCPHRLAELLGLGAARR
jgi:hypothetical protein